MKVHMLGFAVEVKLEIGDEDSPLLCDQALTFYITPILNAFQLSATMVAQHIVKDSEGEGHIGDS